MINFVLSNDFIVACEIYNLNQTCFEKLVDSLRNKLDRKTIANSVDTLHDWGIVQSEYDSNCCCRIFKIHNEHKLRIKELYDFYFKNS